MQFSTLGLIDPILRALTEEGYTTPTPIQAQAIPPALEGRDLLGCAQTGTGKTAAFALPIIQKLAVAGPDPARRGVPVPRALILSPTRELATQIADSFATYGRHVGLRHTVVFGGVSQFHQVRALHRGVDVLVATPGRLMDLMQQKLVVLTSVNTFVLDEADRMLDMGFIQPIRRIVAAIPAQRQTLLFSATMPVEIMRLADSLLRSPVKVAVTPVASTAKLIEQSVYMVPRKSKQALLEHLLGETGVDRALVFTRTKHGADRVARHLNRAGVRADAIHGNKAQNQRQRVLDSFRSGHSRVLVATDVAARGLDVDNITHVFNFDIPNEPESYVHRIGRTGRAGATGKAISFCDGEERGFLRAIEKLTGKKVPSIDQLPDLPEPVREQTYDAPAQHAQPRPRNARPQGGRPQRAEPHHAPRHAGVAPAGSSQRSAPRQAAGSAPAGASHSHGATGKPRPRPAGGPHSTRRPSSRG